MLTNPVRLLAALPPPARLLVIGTFVNKLGTFILPYLTLVLQREFRLAPAQGRAVGFAGLRAAVNLGFSFGVAWLLFRLDRTAHRQERLRGLAVTGASA